MEKYKIEIKKSAFKEIEKLPKKAIKKIMAKIKSLALNPRGNDCEKLSNQERYRIRCGIYRILYEIKDDVLVIIIVNVAHRKDIYRRF